MPDRKKAPKITKLNHLILPDYQLYTLSNGVRICEVNSGSQDIVKLEVFHKAGRSIEDHHLAGRAVASLIKDGTVTKSSAQLSEAIDYYGASIYTGSIMDYSYTTLYCLTKHFANVIPVLQDMYHNPTFPEDEIEKFKKLNIQKLREELSKNEFMAYRHFTEQIYGSHHPYGYNSTENDYASLNKAILKAHFDQYYGTDNCTIFLSGRLSDEIRKLTIELFDQDTTTSKKKVFTYLTPDQSPKKLNFTSKNEHQSALKIGRHLFNKSHKDQTAFFLLNVVLGGYFGSRLMLNIREEKGYTYDISSHMDQHLYDGCFYISTEAASEYIDPILMEIHHEMDVLCQHKISNKELDMVKNYLMGTFLNMLDGPMNISSALKNMILIDKKPEDFITFSEELVQMTRESLIDVAQKYLNFDQLIEVQISPETQNKSQNK